MTGTRRNSPGRTLLSVQQALVITYDPREFDSRRLHHSHVRFDRQPIDWMFAVTNRDSAASRATGDVRRPNSGRKLDVSRPAHSTDRLRVHHARQATWHGSLRTWARGRRRGPRTWRSRSPWPCSTSLPPVGRLAALHATHAPGRASSTDGGDSIQPGSERSERLGLIEDEIDHRRNGDYAGVDQDPGAVHARRCRARGLGA